MQRRMPFLLVVKRGANNGWLLVITCYIFCFTMHLSIYLLVNISRLVCKSILRKVNKSACMAKSGLKIGQFLWTSCVSFLIRQTQVTFNISMKTLCVSDGVHTLFKKLAAIPQGFIKIRYLDSPCSMVQQFMSRLQRVRSK